MLAQYYKEWEAANPGKKFEVIFVSSDQTDKDFDGYYAEMPWAALKFEARDKKVGHVGSYQYKLKTHNFIYPRLSNAAFNLLLPE